MVCDAGKEAHLVRKLVHRGLFSSVFPGFSEARVCGMCLFWWFLFCCVLTL